MTEKKSDGGSEDIVPSVPGARKSADTGKGKERAGSTAGNSSVTDRLQSSGSLALNALLAGPDNNISQNAHKGSAPGRDWGRLSSESGEMSMRNSGRPGPGDSLRSQPPSTLSGQDFAAFVEMPASLAMEPTDTARADPYIARQEITDGSDVVKLLDQFSNEPPSPTSDDYGDDMPSGELPQASGKLREALFAGAATSIPWDHLLNFTPDYLNRPDPEAAMERQLHFGTADMHEARSAWFQQWSDVLDSYTDHVWGELEPLAAEARREVDEFKKDGRGMAVETKALDRLRMILAHVRGQV